MVQINHLVSNYRFEVPCMASFGQRLRILREEKEMGQKEVGSLIGVSESTIAKYESDQRTPNPDTIVTLAKFFGVSTDFLLGFSEIRNLETIAAHRTDDPLSDLPPEARKSVEDFIQFVRKQYGTKE